MLSGLLRSETAIQANILIMRAFVAMRRFLVANAQIFQRLDRLDRKQLENEQKFEKVFAKWQTPSPRWGRCSRARLSPRARRCPYTWSAAEQNI